jgi:hypothetical protein
LIEKETEVIAIMQNMLAGEHFALTDYGWTSRTNKSYTKLQFTGSTIAGFSTAVPLNANPRKVDPKQLIT